jgi:hypothetical protein
MPIACDSIQRFAAEAERQRRKMMMSDHYEKARLTLGDPSGHHLPR